MKLLVVNGPNLNLLGRREPSQYGSLTLDDINKRLADAAAAQGVQIEIMQSNAEGEIVTAIQKAAGACDGIILNPGAYTHTSIAIRDAITASGVPVVEVHLSNIYSREDFRQHSFVSGVALGVISGFREDSYLLGLEALVRHLRKKPA